METLALPMIIGGGALSAFSTLEEGEEAAEQGKIMQQQYAAEAAATRMASGEKARMKRKEGREIEAEQVTALGGKISGSNLLVLMDTARKVEMDASTIERNASVKAGYLEQKGRIARYKGKMAKRSAGIRALAGAVSTIGQAYFLYHYPQPKTITKLSAENKAALYGGRL